MTTAACRIQAALFVLTAVGGCKSMVTFVHTVPRYSIVPAKVIAVIGTWGGTRPTRYQNALDKLEERYDEEETSKKTAAALVADAAAAAAAKQAALAKADAVIAQAAKVRAAQIRETAVVNKEA